MDRQKGRAWMFDSAKPAISRLAGLLLPFCMGGCATFWDDVTSREFSIKDKFQPTKPPIEVLQTSTDGDKRSKALSQLNEPLRHGGNQEQQDLVVKILVDAATTDRQSLCRLRAIESMKKFKDPRVVEGLKEAYYRAGSFNPEIATVIRAQSLESLGVTANPEAIELLVKVANEPAVVGAEQDRQMKIDERTAAARALGNFKEGEASAALVQILKADKDVALRDVARSSLQKMTGHKAPAEAQVWEEYLAKDPASRESSWFRLASFWK